MRSTVVGNQVTDLMQEISSALNGETLPVHSDVMDIFGTQVVENDRTLVGFVLGVRTLTLHFKYE